MKTKLILSVAALAVTTSAFAANVETVVGSKNKENDISTKISESINKYIAIENVDAVASLTVSTSGQHILDVKVFTPTGKENVLLVAEIGLEKYANGAKKGTTTSIDGVVTVIEGGLGTVATDGKSNTKSNAYVNYGVAYSTPDYQALGVVSIGTSKVEAKAEGRYKITNSFYSITTVGYTMTNVANDKNAVNAQIGVGYNF